MPPKRKAADSGTGLRKRTRSEVAETNSGLRNGTSTSSTTAPIAANVSKPRGRPPKRVAAIPATKDIDFTTNDAEQSVQPARKRGRPRKEVTLGIRDGAAKSSQTRDNTGTSIKRGRGRPRKSQPSTSVDTTPLAEVEDADVELDQYEDIAEDSGEPQYWLMKAEPNDRLENGHNVKFSIDDLAAADSPEPWDGVRNYVARNNMRSMRKGDLAFFYHSNCKTPGVVGVMRVVQEHSTDESAFDSKHPYYDPKSSREKPKWDLVHVEFVKKFEKQITLKDINDNAATTGELAEMALLKYKRLSVTGVQPAEWRFILQLAGDATDVGTTSVVEDGYTSHTEDAQNSTVG